MCIASTRRDSSSTPSQALLAAERPRGRRVGVVGDGGGYGAVASDLLGLHGLELPVLSEVTQSTLRSSLPPTAATANPVDLAGAGEQDTFSFVRATRTLLEADGIDAVLFTAYFGGYSALSAELRDARARRGAGKLARCRAGDADGRSSSTRCTGTRRRRAALRAAGIPVYRAVESAVAALDVLAADASRASRADPAAAARRSARVAEDGLLGAPARHSQRQACRSASATGRATGRRARCPRAELGYPVVLKALGALHKSDAGGVVLGVLDAEALAAAIDRLSTGEYSVERLEDTAAGSSCWWARAATRASARSSSSAQAAPPRSSFATPPSRSRR